MKYELENFINTIEQNQGESSVNTHQLSVDVMQVLDTARAQLGVVYPADLSS